MDLSAISSLVQTIGGLLTEEVTSLLGMEEQVEFLQRELIWMQSFLKVADARKADSEVIRTCVAEIRELAYDAEDVIEHFALKVASKRKGGISNFIKRSACILNEGWLLCQTKKEIEKITARIRELTRQLKTYDVTILRDGAESSSSEKKGESRRAYPHVIDDNIVGLDEDIKKLVSVLVDEESDCRVVSICGMGGLGKTTLAKKVYQHSIVKDHFNHLAWVYVSQQCQKKKVWQDILSGFHIMDEDDRRKREEDLAEKLFNFLKDKKWLLILDDIWSIEAWDCIKPALLVTATRSKILLTSRNKAVASQADRRCYLHELECLKEEESWELFQKIAFADKDSPDCRVDGRMEKLGKNMVKYCAGLPLAIIVLGGILAMRSSLSEWQIVYENVKSLLKSGKMQGIAEVLALSFDDLPSYLRSCFLYLSHFPEDYEIDAQRLIQLWIAESIVSLKQDQANVGEIIEDVAEGYLLELAQRCMIQVRQRDVATLKIRTVQIHDMMRDLCLSKAKGENLLFIMERPIPYPHGKSVSSSMVVGKVRRLAAHHFYRIQCIRSPHLRSVLVFNDFFPNESMERYVPQSMLKYFNDHADDEHWDPLTCTIVLLVLCIGFSKAGGIWTYIFNNFKLLRVLDFEGKGQLAGCKLPKGIGKLIHLRFLSLRDLEFATSKLPYSLGNLRFLLTLDLRSACNGILSDSVHVPNVIWRMEQLRHLYLPAKCKCKTKLKLGTLRNLQTLVNFNSKSCYAEDLINMTNLRELEIRGQFNIEGFKEDLDKKSSPIIGSKCLQSLSIFGDAERIDPIFLAHLLLSCVCICKLSLEVEIGKLPEYHHFSEDITYIYLSETALDEDPMPILEKLKNLRIMKLSNSAFTGKAMICSAQGFPRLDSLSLESLGYLEELKADEGAMPVLRCLEIINCRNMKTLPDGLSFITTLQELAIKRMPKTFKDKLVEGGEDFYKVKHVPSITFQDCYG